MVENILPKEEAIGYSELSERERTVFNVSWLDTEVNNGGFHQFFWNPSGDRTSDTLRSLAMIGAEYTKSLLQRACEAFPAGQLEVDQRARHVQLDQLSDDQVAVLDKISDAYGDRDERVMALLLAYWRAS
jgi:hypothetical protein